jgi:hypothetical protein
MSFCDNVGGALPLPDSTLTCSWCGLNFEDARASRAHIRLCTKKIPVLGKKPCPFCNDLFTPSGLKSHQRSCIKTSNSVFDSLHTQFEYQIKSTSSDDQINNHSVSGVHGFRYHNAKTVPPDGVSVTRKSKILYPRSNEKKNGTHSTKN